MIPVCGAVLAGGKSSRMGSNKALLSNGALSFVEHQLDILRFLPERLISLNHPGQLEDKALRESVPIVMDERDSFGPLEGIYQLLCASSEPYVLAIATDMQCLTEDFLRCVLKELKPEDDCLVLKSQNGPEPLCSVYGKSVLPELEVLRAQEMKRPRMLFDRVHTHYVTASDLGLSEEKLLYFVSNINTPEDYQKYLTENKAAEADSIAKIDTKEEK